jgi:hypothetical protein
MRVRTVTSINLQYLPNREARTGLRPVSFLPWSHIGGVARTIAIIASLMIVATVPILLRLWLFFPAIHD